MSSWLTPSETYTESIAHPYDEAAEPLEVELRYLNAGDKAELEDTIAITGSDPDNPEVGVKLGTMKLLTVSRALVRWSIPEAPTPAILRRLDPAVLESIFSRIRMGAAVPPTAPADASSSSAAETSS